MNAPALLSKKEFGARARCSPKTVNKLLASPDGPRVTRIGKRAFIREDHLQSWLDRCARSQQPAVAK